MTPDSMLRELATELQHVLRDLDEAHLRENPDDEFHDLAARLLIKLSRKGLTLTPVVSPAAVRRAEITRARGEAAARIFDIFTTWLAVDRNRSYITGTMPSGRFEIQLREGGMLRAFFMGESIQDAYAQAAQTISFNGGSLDEEQTQNEA